MAPGPSARRPLRSWGRRAPQSSAVSAARAPSLPSRRCTTRRGPSESAEFVAITAALRELTADFVLDGEAVAHCSEGLPDFHGLLGREGQRTACLYAFDLLRLRATDLRPVELVGRRAMLKKLIRKAAPVLIFSEHMDAADGERMFRHACALGLEGIVSKRLDSRYKSGRCLTWVKIKNPEYVRQA
jgi:bifunctional non-homologous end joining protein LigD